VPFFKHSVVLIDTELRLLLWYDAKL